MVVNFLTFTSSNSPPVLGGGARPGGVVRLRTVFGVPGGN